MGSELTLFVRSLVPEQVVLRELSSAIGFRFESIDYPDKKASGFLQYTEYSEGFEASLTISWREHKDISTDSSVVAQRLANAIRSDILFESKDSVSGTVEEVWLLSSPDKIVRRVNIIEHKDGIDIESKT